MGDETWVWTWVVKDGTKRYGGSRHLGAGCQALRGKAVRELTDEELVYYPPCGLCLTAEADGPADTRAEAMSVIREAANACAEASMRLDELGHHRMASRMRTTAERSYGGAESMEAYA